MAPLSVNELRELRNKLPADTPENVNVREELLVEARKLLLSLERQDNVVERVCFQLWETAMIRVGVDVGVFKELKASEKPKSTKDIAETTGADPLLLGRVLRGLGSFGAIHEADVDLWAPNTVSNTFAETRNEAAIEGCFDFLSPGWLSVPAYLKEKGHKNPTSATDTAFAKAYNKPNGATLWEIMLANPQHVKAMNLYMSSFNEGHKDWTEIYPVDERLGQGAKDGPEDVMMVDVGGGFGHQAVKLKKNFPNLPGRYIVQDIPQGLPQDKPEGVEFKAHDFFEEQPIKGARVYYLRYVVHDWSQEMNTKILSKLREALTPGYSRVIIHEWIVPAKGASKFMTAQDMNMMAVSGGIERTEDLHREYIEKAGLKVTGIWNPGDNISESVIEVQL